MSRDPPDDPHDLKTTPLSVDDVRAPDAPTLVPSPEEPAPQRQRLVAGRYRLVVELGRGGNGSVYEAGDTLTGLRVAVKLVYRPTGRVLERIRAEVTALRWLRLPGVVRLLDDGLDHGDYFLVMELVRGRSFLGAGPYAWDEVASPVRELLEHLARVHLAGVLHRDLKPQNVLLDQDGHPVLVDFGIAKGRALLDEAGEGSGTVRYVAPEQALARPCGAQADLYALGVMLYEALSGGQLPQAGGPRQELLRQRVHEEPRPLLQVAPRVPPAVAAVVDHMVARDPAHRPASALEVLERLGGRRPAVLDGRLAASLSPARPATAAQLRALFEGPDHFLHLRRDAAEVLHLRTGGHAELVADELALWVQAGLAHWKRVDERELVAIDRVAIERLRAGEALAVGRLPPAHLSPAARALLTWLRRAWPDTAPTPVAELADLAPAELAPALAELTAAHLAWPLPDGRIGVRPVALAADRPDERRAQQLLAARLPEGSEARLRHLLAGGAPVPVVLRAAVDVVDALLRDGQHARVVALLELALHLVRSDPELEHHEEGLLTTWAKVAMAQESRAAAERALYEVGRARVRSWGLDRVERLLVAWRSAVIFEADRAWEVAEALGTFEDDELECWRVGAMLNAAVRQGFEARFLAELDEWERQGRDPALRQAKRAGWLGNLAYRESRFPDAVAWHRRAVEGKRALDARVSARLNLASALLEAGQLAEAEAEASRVCAEAEALRHGAYAALGLYLQRAARFRAGHPVQVYDDELAAARAVNARCAAVLAMVGAAAAARQGRAAPAARHAQLAATSFAAVSAREPGLLCAVFAACLDGAASPSVDPAAVAAMQVPGLKAQALALLRWASGARRPPDPAERRVHAAWPSPDPRHRRELLSLAECQAPQPPWSPQ